jgi:hypothetical protein
VLFHEAVGKRLGISATERKLLDVLDRLGPSTAGELATRQPNPHDRRSVIVTLAASPALEQLGPEVFAPLGQAIADFSAQYRPAELASIASYLAGLTDILHEQTVHLHSQAASTRVPDQTGVAD